jgi:hypothetical protein
MGRELDRSLRKTVNTVIRHVDRLTTAAIASAVTTTHPAIAPWSDDPGARMYRDLELAAAVVIDINEGFMPDMALMSTNNYALLISDDKVANMRRRETRDNPIYGAGIDQIGNYTIVFTAAANLPTDDVWLFDSDELGGMADEANADPGYATSSNGVQVQNERIKGRDGWDLWARRITVPVVLEPQAGIRLIGTVTS